MSNEGEIRAMQYCMEQIQQSDQPGREVVLGAMALWVAAHGDFKMPQSTEKILTTEPTVNVEDDPLEIDEGYDVVPTQDILPSFEISNDFVTLADSKDISSTGIFTDMSDVERTAELNVELQSIIEPIVMAARLKMPSVAQYKDKKSFWRLHNIGQEQWKYDRRLDNRHMYYEFTVAYTPDANSNKLKSFEMNFGTGGARHYTLNLSLNKYGNTETVTIIDQRYQLQLSDTYLRDIIKAQNPSLVTQPLKSAQWDKDILGGDIRNRPGSLVDDRPYNYSYHKFSIGGPSIKYSSYSSANANLHSSPGTQTISRRFVPSTDCFETIRLADNETMYGDTMPKDKVIELLKTIIDLIPTTALDTTHNAHT